MPLTKKQEKKVKEGVLKEIMEREKEHHLGLWCMEQARAYKKGKLSKEKIKLLKEIKFPFDHYLNLKRKKVFTLQRWVHKKGKPSKWKTEITLIEKELDKIEEIVKKYPKAGFRLLDDNFEVIALKRGNDKSLNFKGID